MALTTLDPITALIIVDLQRGLVGSPLVHPVGDVVARACTLTAAFRQRGLPVVLVNVDGGAPGRTERPRPGEAIPDGWTNLIPELARQVGDIVVTKRTWGAFASTDLERQLLRARSVTLATDAMTDARPDAHDYSIANVFPRLGETGATQSIIDLLERTHA